MAERNDDTAERGRRDIFSYAVTDGYGNMMRRAGFDDEISALREAHERRDRRSAVAAISDRLVDAIDFVGPADAARDYLASYVEGGVEEAVVMPLPWGPDRGQVIDDTLVALAGAGVAAAPAGGG